MVMKRGQNVKLFLSQPPVPVNDEERFWGNLSGRIGGGQVIPIISNQLFYDLVFSQALGGSEEGNSEATEAELKTTVSHMLSMAWASELHYPFPDSHDLARVAQYVRSKARASVDAKEEYLRFIKNALLSYASQVGGDADQIDELRSGLAEYSFADLVVNELGLLKFGPGCTDPISILAGLPLPIYITTSPHDILERALQAMGKQPISQVCFWSGAVNPLREEHKPLETYEATVQRPMVYHLFGLDCYPLSMVLGEDDYMDFLVELTLDRGTSHAIIPSYLQSALAVSWLMLIGYHLQEWDFRTLFRGLVSARENKNIAFLNTIIQLSLVDQYSLPQDQTIRQCVAQAQTYLQSYFNPLAFEIRWNDPTTFLNQLQKEWRARRQR